MAEVKSTELTIWIKNTDHEQKNSEIIRRNSLCGVLRSPLVWVKTAFFFWFMGGSEVMAFSSLFFKQQGLTIRHISLITSISGVLEVVTSLWSGVILDRFGRAKLVLLTNIGIAILVSLSLVLLPSVRNCNHTELLLHCNDSLMVKMSHHEICNSIDVLLSKNCSTVDLIPDGHICNSTDVSLLKNCSSVHLTPDGLVCYSTDGRVALLKNCNSTHFSPDGPVCNSTDVSLLKNCSSVHLSPDVCRDDVIKVPPEQSSAPLNSTSHKIRLMNVDPRRVVECNLNSSVIHESNCQCFETENTPLLVLYGILICLFHNSRSAIYRFYDFIGVSLSAKHNADFGRQRMCGVFGILFGPSAVGYIIRSLNDTGQHQQPYFVAFLAYILLVFLSGLSVCNVDCRVKPPSERVWKQFFALLKNPHMNVYLVVLFAVGTSFQFNAIYLGLFQEELGSSAFIIGLTSTVMSACGLPFLLTARWWIRILGHRTMFSLALFLSALFHVAVSFAESSLPVMFLVLVNIFTYHLMWVEAMNFARNVAPEGVTGTVIFTAGCVFFVITKASASLIGGMVMSAYGSRMAHRAIGAMCLLTGVLYLLSIACCSPKREESQEQHKPCAEDSESFL